MYQYATVQEGEGKDRIEDWFRENPDVTQAIRMEEVQLRKLIFYICLRTMILCIIRWF